MKSIVLKLLVILAAAGLTACSTNFLSGNTETASNQTVSPEGDLSKGLPNSLDRGVDKNAQVGGSFAGGMDANDRVKMTRALDKPLGKSTTWDNANTGTSYTVMPVSKVTVNGNPFCRRYTTTVTRGGSSQEQSGTACVASDGNWHPLSG